MVALGQLHLSCTQMMLTLPQLQGSLQTEQEYLEGWGREKLIMIANNSVTLSLILLLLTCDYYILSLLNATHLSRPEQNGEV